MKKNIKILSLSAAMLLVVLVIVIRRRGRKVSIAEPYRLNAAYDILLFDQDLSHFHFYRGTLDYVIMPYDWKNKSRTIDRDGIAETYYPVIGIGFNQPSGKVKRIMFKETVYIEDVFIGIEEE